VLSLGNILSNLLRANSHFGDVLKSLLYEIPLFLVKIFPVSCLIASLFSLNKLKNRNELTAIFASGFSRKNFILTIATLGFLVGVSLFYINSYLVPYSRHRAYLELNVHGDSSVTVNAINSGRIWFKGKNYFVSYANFDAATNTLNNLELYYFNPDFRLVEQIKAQTARFLHDQTWLLSPFIHSTNLQNTTFPNIEEHKFSEWFIDENIQDFKKINADISTLSIWKLFEYIQILNSNNLNADEYYVSFLDKFSSAVTCLVLSLLSAVAIFNPNRRNSSFGLNVSFVLGFTFLYWFIYSYFLTLGQGSRIPATVATFGVPTLFVIYLAFFFLYHRKLR
jgi:lipopolysaccharide export system permease protein